MERPMKPDNVVIDLTKETIDKRKMSSEVNSELTNVTKKIKKYKTWTDPLCKCNIKCSECIPMWAREELFHMFAGMNDDDGNQFLRTCIDFSRPKNPSSVGETRTKKRVEYIIPIMVSDHSSFGSDDKKSPVISEGCQNDKALESYSTETARKLSNSYDFVKICQQAFFTLFGLTLGRFLVIKELFLIQVNKEEIKRMMETELNKDMEPNLVVEAVLNPEEKTEINPAKGTNSSLLKSSAKIKIVRNGRPIGEQQLLYYRKINGVSCADLIVDFLDNQLWKPELLRIKK